MSEGPVTIDMDIASFHAALKAAGGAVSGRVIVTALKSGGLIVQNDAKIKCPYVTGNLKRSIHMEVLEQQPMAGEVAVGTNVDYARIVEFGSAGKDARGRIHNRPAKPYLRPALNDNRAAIQGEFETVLRISLAAEGLL